MILIANILCLSAWVVSDDIGRSCGLLLLVCLLVGLTHLFLCYYLTVWVVLYLVYHRICLFYRSNKLRTHARPLYTCYTHYSPANQLSFLFFNSILLHLLEVGVVLVSCFLFCCSYSLYISLISYIRRKSVSDCLSQSPTHYFILLLF